MPNGISSVFLKSCFEDGFCGAPVAALETRGSDLAQTIYAHPTHIPLKENKKSPVTVVAGDFNLAL